MSTVAADLYAPPDEATVNRAIEEYAGLVRSEYGPRIAGIYLFGSRARGDHALESDADLAIVLEDGDWDYWTEKMRLTDLTYDILLASGADLQAWPVRAGEWENPNTHSNPPLIRAMRADGRPIGFQQ